VSCGARSPWPWLGVSVAALAVVLLASALIDDDDLEADA
jgi:hypothetical protein